MRDLKQLETDCWNSATKCLDTRSYLSEESSKIARKHKVSVNFAHDMIIKAMENLPRN